MDLINLKYFTDFSCLVKFSVAVAVAVAFINLCADASHVVGDVCYYFYSCCRCYLFANVDTVLVVTNTLITSKG